ncbi:MAG: amidase domain-containing protein [Bacteroides sp.]|nr:amidase domain-containing protein [Bacteroides sp.]
MKNTSKKFLSLGIALGIVLCGSGAYAAESGNNSPASLDEGFDTLSLTQRDYESIAFGQSSTFSLTGGRDEEEAVENTCKAYIAASRAYVRKPEKYSGKAFVEKESVSSATVEYRSSEFEYLNKLNEATDAEIVYDSLSFSGFKADINGGEAEASIVEEYTYYRDDGFDIESFRMREYTFKLVKGESGWEITDVRTNDAWEDEDFDYEPIDADKAVAMATEAVICEPIRTDAAHVGTEAGILPMWSQTLYTWSYNTTAAVNYAKLYYKKANTVFGVNDADCQNFVSQCIWAGLGGSGSNTKSAPAVSTDITGTSNSPYLWYRSCESTYYPSDQYKKNWMWDNTVGFTTRIAISDGVTPGPYGYMTYGSAAIANANVGQALYYIKTQPEGDLPGHAVFVTNVKGTAGSRTANDIYIAAHSNPTNSAYQLMSSYGISSLGYATATIRVGYYPTKQK